eukprot:11352092-Alexandrium_andersonii.AAC.2
MIPPTTQVTHVRRIGKQVLGARLLRGPSSPRAWPGPSWIDNSLSWHRAFPLELNGKGTSACADLCHSKWTFLKVAFATRLELCLALTRTFVCVGMCCGASLCGCVRGACVRVCLVLVWVYAWWCVPLLLLCPTMVRCQGLFEHMKLPTGAILACPHPGLGGCAQ